MRLALRSWRRKASKFSRPSASTVAPTAPDEREEEDGLQDLDALLRLGRLGRLVGPRPPIQMSMRAQRVEEAHHRRARASMSVVGTGDLHSRRTNQRHGATNHSKSSSSDVRLSLVTLPAAAVEPRGEEGAPAELTSAPCTPCRSARRSRAGDGEVHRLEEQVHHGRHRDDLAAHQAELLVVVEHRVHVLDPDRVDGAVEDDPLVVLARVHGALRKMTASTPSVHSCVSSSNSPYSWPSGTTWG